MVLTLGQLTTARHALLGAKNAAEAVAAAIRTVRDLGNSGRNGDVALRDANQSGWVNATDGCIESSDGAGWRPD